ncbi:MAG: chorismate mutase [Gammaproteobacteria bacterium]|nr:chorismate mutase [Gammaproteobacteria bacterium]
MTEESIPPQLLEARNKIDEVDNKLILLLAERFDLTRQVGELKARSKLSAFDPGREARKLATIRALCKEHELNVELVEGIFSQIMTEVVKNHRRFQGE